MIGYFVCVALGIAAALVARALQGAQSALESSQRAGVLLFAIGGAILGAYGFQLPADVFGWHAPHEFDTPDGLPLGGRTVLGGLIGGWLAVEAGKRAFGIRVPTGDEFALPLALALGFGRLGCLAAGCCAGMECASHPLASLDAHGVPRVPVQALESAFHLLAAGGIAWALRQGRLRGARLAAYLTLYGLVRFGLEFLRLNPPVLGRLTYHQLLALLLIAIAGTTWWRRSRSAASQTHASALLPESRVGSGT